MEKLLIANMADIDPLGSRTVRVRGVDIAIFRLSDGEVMAVENKCPHKGGALSEGMVCGKAVHCPLHDWKIDLRTGRAHEPDEGCVGTFEVDVDRGNGAIYLKV